MIVVADSSPLVALSNLQLVEILPRLFGTVTAPPDVIAEIASSRRPTAAQILLQYPPPWLLVRAPLSNPPISHLHAGETAAINLASELGASLVLMDERAGRAAAVARHLHPIGTIGLLERAALQGWLDLRETFARLRATDFWVSDELLNERLRVVELQLAQRLQRGIQP